MEKFNISKKSILIFGALQIGIALIAFILFGLIPVNREFRTISAKVEAKSTGSNSGLPKGTYKMIDTVRTNEHHEAYLRSVLKLSKTDSISLLIDLRDSLAFLSLKGVYLFQSKISKVDINKGLKKLPDFLRDSLYSGPMQVDEDISSIERFPIVIKKAPKDTTEANLAGSAPVLPIQNDVFVLLAFSNSMVIEIVQQEHELAGTRKAYRNYNWQYMKWFLSKNFQSFTNSDKHGYIYHMKIEIPREDARSIYRALPIKPFVVVRY